MSQRPLWNTLETIRQKNLARFYMPGHKGTLPPPLSQAAPYDITEIAGADSLYQCTGALRALEEELASAYHVGDTLLSAGGSTLCIQTMLYLARKRGRSIICSRTIHRSAVAVMGLLGLDPCWLASRIATRRDGIPGIALPSSPQEVEAALYLHPDAAGVYLTSPDYFGQMADIAAISDICHRHGKILLVDNAHGAHLGCFRAALHPMSLGADFCCDSLHKTLPALTGAAVLHLADPACYPDAKYAMSLFGSSSPSYLIMLSVENALEAITSSCVPYWELSGVVNEMKAQALAMGYDVVKDFVSDPIRLSVGFESLGYSQEGFGKLLRTHGVEPEYLSKTACVFLLSPQNTPEEITQLRLALAAAAKNRDRLPEPSYPSVLRLPRQLLSLGEAMARREGELPVTLCQGRVASRLVSVCPPCIPLVVPGEEITPETIKILQSSGIQRLFVVK